MKKLFVYTAALAALILFPNFIKAQTLTWDETNAERIEQNIGNGEYPQIAISGNTAVAVWQQSDSFSSICSSYSTDGGATWSDTQLIEAGAGNAYNPQVAISGDTVVAVWQQNDGVYWNIYSNYSVDGGVNWAGVQLINSTFETAQYPQIAISGNNVVVVWMQGNGGNNYIYSNYSADGGAVWVGDVRIDNLEDRDAASNPQIAISGDNVVAVWEQVYYATGDFCVYSNYSTDGGASWNSALLIASGPSTFNPAPQVAISGSSVVAVWNQNNVGVYRTYSNYSADGGAVWVGEQRIDSFVGLVQYPQVAISGNTAVAV